ncbi:MAG: protein arginine kinase [Syntrophomonas sp.]|nr:protein arginine kinase [Syntrophomonas sp.]
MSITDVVNSSFVKWMDTPAGERDIVVSSRIRLARNINMIPFPHLLDQVNGEKCIEQIKNAWQKSPASSVLASMDMISFDQLPALERQILAEKHLISPLHAESDSPFRGVLVNSEGYLSAMINEEDHLRIQCLLPGLKLSDCYMRVQELDNEFENSLEYAFDENRGYLTACPTNVGTGMRASVMMHLPAIQMTGQLNQIIQNIAQLGLVVRGLYGEGSEAIGNFFQISNQITLGQTEEDIYNYLHTISEQIAEQEKLLRERLEKDLKYQLEDKIGRSYGILSNARVITANEALTLFSDVRLGVDMGILKGINIFSLNELMVEVKPAHMQKRTGKEMDAIERDIKRAEVIKKKLGTISE